MRVAGSYPRGWLSSVRQVVGSGLTSDPDRSRSQRSGPGVPAGPNPRQELSPCRGEALVSAVVDCPSNRRGGPQPGLHPAVGGHRRRDRDADLEVEDVRGSAQVMREPRSGGGKSLSTDGGQHLADAGAHHGLDLGTRDGEAEGRGPLVGGPGDVRCIEHEMPPFAGGLRSEPRSDQARAAGEGFAHRHSTTVFDRHA
jgi:hypothetical protein